MKGRYLASNISLGEVRKSIGAMLLDRCELHPEDPAFADRREDKSWRLISWEKLLGDIASLAKVFAERGLGSGDRLGCFSPNCYEMLVWEMAVTSIGAISVPIFSRYGRTGLDYILCHASPKALFVYGAERLELVESCSGRQGLSLFTSHDSDYECVDTLLCEPDLRAFEAQVEKVDAHHQAFLQYTSGTTGEPKGVMLSHRNVLSQQAALDRLWNVMENGRFLSYLPWHHSFGGLFERFTALDKGATLYLEDTGGRDIGALIDSWREVRPTQFFSVPKIYAELVTEARLDDEVRRTIFNDELSFVFTAAAPLSQDCSEYFAAHDVPVLEGWGLTETSPCVTLTTPESKRVSGCVGLPIPGCEIIIDESDQILVRGPNLMSGYYKDPERSARAIDHNGWFKTGDLGELGELGLRIICRSDGLFKLSNGEKVSSMQVENRLIAGSRWIQNAVALGSGEDFVSALLFPNLRALAAWAEEQGWTLPIGDELAASAQVRELLMADIIASQVDVQPSYSTVRSFVLVPSELTIEGGELTPSMKVVRHRVIDSYQARCEAIYRPERYPHLGPFLADLREAARA